MIFFSFVTFRLRLLRHSFDYWGSNLRHSVYITNYSNNENSLIANANTWDRTIAATTIWLIENILIWISLMVMNFMIDERDPHPKRSHSLNCAPRRHWTVMLLFMPYARAFYGILFLLTPCSVHKKARKKLKNKQKLNFRILTIAILFLLFLSYYYDI